MAGIRVKVAEIREHGVIAVYICNIANEQLDHPAPAGITSPILIRSGNLRRCFNEISIMEMMIVQFIGCSVAIWVPDHGSPIVIVVEDIGRF
ncbi:hypothetical protein D3C77_616580 [compost metagenome]